MGEFPYGQNADSERPFKPRICRGARHLVQTTVGSREILVSAVAAGILPRLEPVAEASWKTGASSQKSPMGE